MGFSHLLQESSLNLELASYFALTFAISWGAVWVTTWPTFSASPAQVKRYLPIAVAGMVAGPSLAGLGMAYSCDGNLEALKQRFFKRFAVGWYPIVLLTAPVAIVSLLTLLAQIDTRFRPALFTTTDPVPVIGMGLAYGTVAGLFEELGWSGFAVPYMLAQEKSEIITGLWVGLLWGLWHFNVAVWGSGGDDNGSFRFELFLPWIPWNLAVLPMYRVLMVHVYKHTKSGWSMALMHGALTASLPIIFMPDVKGVRLAVFYTLLAFTFALILEGMRAFDARKHVVHHGKTEKTA